ncbi:MAG: rRNA maturation RNase YbeY [Pseudomonadales bacterium]
MPVEVQIATDEPAPAPELIERWAQGALSCLDGPDAGAADMQAAELCVRVVTAGESRQLNAAYRHIDKPTNVLSFPADVALPDVRVLGDIVVCAAVVAAEAAAQGKRLEDHFAHMIVHGVLHLLGYDHDQGDEAERMESLEREILGRFDIADPYQPA